MNGEIKGCASGYDALIRGEAARLLGQSTTQINADRYAAAQSLADRYKGVCLLKGAGTVIANRQVPYARVLRGGRGWQRQLGMGDVLTGVIAGLLGRA